MNNEEIEQAKSKIEAMGHVEMASLYRHAPSGHPYFDVTLPLWKYFQERFNKLGGMAPKISKQIDKRE